MLYTLEMLKSAGLAGDGVLLEARPRCVDLIPLLSMLVFLSASLFSRHQVSRLGRLDTTDGLLVNSVCEDAIGGRLFSERSFFGIVSMRLGSVSSRMSDSGRVLAQEVMLLEWPLDSPNVVLTIPWLSPGSV